MPVWKFAIQGDVVSYSSRKRQKLTGDGCNEPFKNRFWCPKKQWFQREPCPFICRRECENYEVMCGCL